MIIIIIQSTHCSMTIKVQHAPPCVCLAYIVLYSCDGHYYSYFQECPECKGQSLCSNWYWPRHKWIRSDFNLRSNVPFCTYIYNVYNIFVLSSSFLNNCFCEYKYLFGRVTLSYLNVKMANRFQRAWLSCLHVGHPCKSTIHGIDHQHH